HARTPTGGRADRRESPADGSFDSLVLRAGTTPCASCNRGQAVRSLSAEHCPRDTHRAPAPYRTGIDRATLNVASGPGSATATADRWATYLSHARGDRVGTARIQQAAHRLASLSWQPIQRIT